MKNSKQCVQVLTTGISFNIIVIIIYLIEWQLDG